MCASLGQCVLRLIILNLYYKKTCFAAPKENDAKRSEDETVLHNECETRQIGHH